MSAMLILQCDDPFGAHSLCARKFYPDTLDLEEATKQASAAGWNPRPNGKISCQGSPYQTPLVQKRRPERAR